ncbi:MAG: zinc-binding alcohol dehydrogenase family protein [Gemmatimonadaceae bacterium]
MRAMIFRGAPPGTPGMLEPAELPAPVPSAGELLVRVAVCGVCRTDLDVVDGRLAPAALPVVPGHQVVGRVAAIGADVRGLHVGQRVGVAWIHSACGDCRWCRDGRENLCPWFVSTGCDHDGGYAELLTVPAPFAHPIPDALDDLAAAPLLCAGAIGWRALRAIGIADGDPLGLTGFGASAHLVLQLARRRLPRSPIYVFARHSDERRFALDLGATWAGASDERPPEPLAAIIDTTPAWTPVVDALGHLAPGGRLVVNAIAKQRGDQDALLRLDYTTHLWMEREIRSVANVTRADVREMLAAGVELGLRPTIEELPLERANEVLESLRRGERVRGARVLRVAR